MTQKEKLIVLLKKSLVNLSDFQAEVASNTLLANGVVVLPCKVGDIVYLKSGRKQLVYEFEIDRAYADDEEFYFFAHEILSDGRLSTSYESFKGSEIGKTVFLTHEEAEAALKKMEGET